MCAFPAVALLVFLIISKGISVRDQGVNLRCRCITLEKRPIGRHIQKLEINLPSSHCKNIEIIAILKKTGQKICLDPDAPWLITVLEKKSAEQIL